jgi:hypothetical protein
MAIRTAGYTAMLAVMAIERQGITSARGLKAVSVQLRFRKLSDELLWILPAATPAFYFASPFPGDIGLI